jgi:DNA-binding SARP family transcriptional activator
MSVMVVPPRVAALLAAFAVERAAPGLQRGCSTVPRAPPGDTIRHVGALVVRVLGELTVDGIDLAPLDRKARTLLRLLALARGRPVSADALAEALWGERPPARPADQLAVLASRLRKVLGRDGVEHGEGGYRLRATRIDLVELESVVRETERRAGDGRVAGAAAAARVALALVRGPLPPTGSGAAWVISEEAAADRLVRRARRVAAAALGAAGSWPDAVDLAAADVLTDPLDEDAVRTLMRGHVALGHTGAALAAYADLRAALAEELGADPAPPTEDLHRAILRGDLPDVATPAGPTDVVLIGRDSQLAHLDSLVARTITESGPRVAVVSGEAGIGKTTLLDRWSDARRAAGDLVLSGTCRPLDRAAPLDVVLAALGRHLRGAPDAEALLAEDLGDGRRPSIATSFLTFSG